MDENPYQKFVGMFRNPDPADGWQLCEGTVKTAQPVTVEAFGLLFAGDGLRINAQLLAGWQQEISLELPQETLKGRETVTAGCLRAGDRVLCFAGPDTLYVLAKVVSG